MPLLVETPRLMIRNFSADEEDAYINLFNNPEVNLHLPKRSEEENRKIFRDTIAADAADPALSKWAIINKADGDFVGMGLLRVFNDDSSVLEVGYALHKKYWGQGIGTELTRALVNFAWQQLGVTTVVAVTTPANIPSQIVLEKAGLINQGSIVRNNEELSFFKMKAPLR